jgi:N-acetylmuramoyl-L-alanine amidase
MRSKLRYATAGLSSLILLFLPLFPSQAAVVCIDPGHPSENGWGAHSASGVREVEVAWEVALLLEGYLKANGVQVKLTKGSVGERVTNRRRAEISNQTHADLFLRLHCDAGAEAHGVTFYYPDRASRMGDRYGPSVRVQRESRIAAQALRQTLMPYLRGHLADRGIKTDAQTHIGSKQGALTGSVYSDAPTVLIEMVSMGSKSDVDFISRPEGKDRYAKGLAAGILAYLGRRADNPSVPSGAATNPPHPSNGPAKPGAAAGGVKSAASISDPPPAPSSKPLPQTPPSAAPSDASPPLSPQTDAGTTTEYTAAPDGSDSSPPPSDLADSLPTIRRVALVCLIAGVASLLTFMITSRIQKRR